VDPFLGEIRIVSFNFPPTGWATCDGQTMQISQNSALYSLLGTLYGGDGSNTFKLPDLRGRVPLHFGSGISQGGTGGGEAGHVLTPAEMPAHTHTIYASDAVANAPSPAGNIWPAVTKGYDATPNATMNAAALGTTGGQAHENCQPYLVLNFVIATTGLFPSRS
jgi:microcystin-dependent protein